MTHRYFFLILFGLFGLFGCRKSERGLYHWDMRTADFGETADEAGLEWQGRTKGPELVQGIAGTALRTDGNTTCVRVSLREGLRPPFTIAGWGALETYPTHHAGFVSLFSASDSTKDYLTAGINTFGNPYLGTASGRTVADMVVPKFQWQHLALSVGTDTVFLLVNGERVLAVENSGNHVFDHLYLGWDVEAHYVHIFPTMHWNGLLDEVSVWPEAFTTEQLQKRISGSWVGSPADLCPPSDRFADDHSRPRYHLLPAANWTNETHGLLFHKGRYHIFNQKNGTNVFLGRINWGHFSSPDLLNWTEHRPAITPEPGYDQLGIWSGHAIVDEGGRPLLFYTGGDGETFGMCLAEPTDDTLLEWKKSADNPLIAGPPEQYRRPDLRDPYLWQEENAWYMIVGYGITEKEVDKGAVLLYRSEDLKNWESLGTLYEHAPWPETPGIFWEMPVFWQMGNKYVLVVNPIPYEGKPARAIYWVGDFRNERFVPDHEQPQHLEVINRLLSPSVAWDAAGKPVAIAIIPDLIPAEMQYERGWTHLYSIPRTWQLVNGTLHQSPHPALQQLRGTAQLIEDRLIEADDTMALAQGHQLELLLELEVGKVEQFGLLIGKNETNGEQTPLTFDLVTNTLTIDHRQSSLDQRVEKRIETGKMDLASGEKLKLHLFIDGSVIEGFINDREAFTTRIFPVAASSNRVELFVSSGALNADRITVWPLRGNGVRCGF